MPFKLWIKIKEENAFLQQQQKTMWNEACLIPTFWSRLPHLSAPRVICLSQSPHWVFTNSLGSLLKTTSPPATCSAWCFLKSLRVSSFESQTTQVLRATMAEVCTVQSLWLDWWPSNLQGFEGMAGIDDKSLWGGKDVLNVLISVTKQKNLCLYVHLETRLFKKEK